ncbi:MAG: hypothetical protein KDI55_24575 [Anaerolineae bacterium]|nr:hypothetical protein [Anaerolineae bacterium]
MSERDLAGITTALELLGAAGGAGADDLDQPELFEAQTPMPLPLAEPQQPTGGRPKGARNKSTEAWVRYFLSQRRSPLTVLGDLSSRPLPELVDQLQEMANKHRTWRDTKDGGYWERVAISPLDVLKLQRDAAIALLPYIHKRQPIALEVDEKPRGRFTVLDMSGFSDVPVGSDDDLALPLPDIEENQHVSSAKSQQSDGQQSDDATMQQQINGLGHDDT